MSETADCRDPAWDLLEKGRKYLAEGDLHQASEKGWGAAAHMAKAVAAARGWEYDTHADFSQVLYQVRRLSGDVHLLVLSQPRNRKGLEAKGRTDGLGPSLRKSVWVIVIWRLTEY